MVCCNKLCGCSHTACLLSSRDRLSSHRLFGTWDLYCRASPMNSPDLGGVDLRRPQKLELPQAPRSTSYVGSRLRRTSSLEYRLNALPQSAPFTALHPQLQAAAARDYILLVSIDRTYPHHNTQPNPTTAATDAANATPLHAAAAATLPGRVVAGSPPASQSPCSPARSTPGAGTGGASASSSTGCRCRSSRSASPTAALSTDRG